MTKKDYEAIAGAMRRIRSVGVGTADYPEAAQHANTLILVERELAGIMAADNPRFDRARFLAACRGEDHLTDRDHKAKCNDRFRQAKAAGEPVSCICALPQITSR